MALSSSSTTTTTAADPLPSLSAWKNKWDTGSTAWHRTQVHPSLQKYADEYLLEPFPAGGAKILVPLCGKSVDLVYLAQKKKVAQVVGVEGVAAAVQAFAQENPDLELTAVLDQQQQCPEGEDANAVAASASSDFTVWEGNSIQMLNGNFFAMQQNDLYDGIWDRAALIAIAPESRMQYVNQLGTLLKKKPSGGGRILLATFVRPDHGKDPTKGPPYSIDEADVRRLFGDQPWVQKITLLEEHSALGIEPWYFAIGMYIKFGGDVREQIFLIETQ
jgi:thiopurine S-methyltransferase